MAYAALFSLAQTTNQILNDDRFPISDNGKHQITSLLKHLTFLQEFLEKFPNEASSFEVRIRHTANEAEDHLERLMYDQIQSHHMEKIYDGPYDFDELIKEVAEKINSISKEAADFKSLNTTETVVLGDAPTVKSLPVVGGVTVGLDDNLVKIKDLLCGESSKLEVIPIVGMGGIGKTTLAMKAYHDQLIVESFRVRAWVTVSQDYKPQNIFADLLDFCKGVGDEGSGKSNDCAQDKVYKFLKGRKYLIVLDDMWSKEAWDEVKRIFPDDGNGSRIVVTTRIEDVGSYADSSNYLHRMHFMEPDRSWDLLKQKVFPDKDCPPELEDIGKCITRSCRGLPLVIVLVAGILSSVDGTQTRVVLLEVAKKVRLAIEGEDGPFEKIISLSYTHLPHHLRPCFLYMGGFPEDYEIRVSKLTKLWIAEGFVEPRDGKSLEERAEEYLEDLVKRSLALVKKRKSNGKIKSCSLHDIVRDFCVKQGEVEKIILSVMDYLPSPILRKHFLPRILKNHGRISATCHDLDFKGSVQTSFTHSIICIPRRGYRSVGSIERFSSLKVFHVLRRNDKWEWEWEWEAGQVYDLIYLTYLACRIPTSTVPPAISKLQNLQTLIIYRSEVLLPVEIWSLRQLRHLIALSFLPLPIPEGATSPLINLETISVVINFVCNEKIVEMIPNTKKLRISLFDEGTSYEKFNDGYLRDILRYLRQLELEEMYKNADNQLHNLGLLCTTNVIEMIPNIKKLGIIIHSGTEEEDYHLHNLVLLSQLEKFKLVVEGDTSSWPKVNPVFPETLKKLVLKGCRFPWKYMEVVGSLPNLRVLKIRKHGCEGDTWETNEEQFPNLEFLWIGGCDLKNWVTERSHFPRLKRLVLLHCFELNEIPDDIGEIPTLELIEVDTCNRFLVKCAKRIREEQHDNGNYDLEVRCVHDTLHSEFLLRANQ